MATARSTGWATTGKAIPIPTITTLARKRTANSGAVRQPGEMVFIGLSDRRLRRHHERCPLTLARGSGGQSGRAIIEARRNDAAALVVIDISAGESQGKQRATSHRGGREEAWRKLLQESAIPDVSSGQAAGFTGLQNNLCHA